jgi:hypothetical protein
MFKAQRGLKEEEIIILDPYWNEENIELLRKQGRADELTCPVCKQPVLVRAGKKKRWHFAHKDLTNCPLKHESLNVLQARVLLYSWLKLKLGGKVTVEQYFPGTDLPRPVDCYAELSNEQKIGYWILDKGIRDRWALQHTFSQLGISIVWVPLTDMLREDEEDQGTVHLTPTERDISSSSDYNQLYSQFDNSLSYLDVEEKTVVTLRGLNCIHSPQKYRFDSKLVSLLVQMLFLPQTGEFVHPGEHERLEELRREIEEQERLAAIEEQKRREEEKKRQQELAEQRKRMFSQDRSQTGYVKDYVSKTPSPIPKPPKEKKRESESFDYLDKQYPCRICGNMTVNWTSLDLGSKTCICSRECLIDSHEEGK